jgi:DNA-binding MarR family transcriptional regulator
MKPSKNKTARHTLAGAAMTDLIVETFRLNGRLLLAGDELTRDLGLSSARWQIMGALADGPAPAAAIARKMGLARQSVQRLVDVLAEERIVAFADNPSHRRAKLVHLTPRGSELLAEVTQRQAGWVNDLTTGVSESDIRSAVQVLGLLRQRLETLSRTERNNGNRRAHQSV